MKHNFYSIYLLVYLFSLICNISSFAIINQTCNSIEHRKFMELHSQQATRHQLNNQIKDIDASGSFNF